ncbi:MAG TPA: aldehyde dehydrogenase family protein [Candidatus Binatia bacterium]|nr:aldehyde dehydrogenase family protein [Candidatus Binatia bacterium]
MNMEVKRNYVAGQWVEGSGSRVNENPSDKADPVGTFTAATAQQVNDAIAAAKKAFPAWSHTSPQVRFDILDKVGTEIIARKEELGRQLSKEEGKTLAEGIGEVTRAGQIWKWFAGEALRMHGDKMAGLRPGTEGELTREPVGVVGIITPWNFPIAIPSWKVAPALAFGNCVVLKPADLVPASSWSIAEIVSRAGVPEGVFNLVMGAGSVVGNAIINHKDVSAVTFTGSTKTGLTVAEACVKRLARVQLEMGGKNPMIVLDDADLDLAVEASFQGAFGSTGQRCTASSRLIVQQGIHDKFVAAMIERLKKTKIDHALEPGSEIGPVVDQRQLDQDLSYLGIGQKEGAKLAFGGELLNRKTQGYYLNCGLFTETKNDMRINREEIFGPISSVIRVKDYDEALSVANDTEYGLVGGICTTSLKHATHFKRNIETGMAMVNLPTAGVDYNIPFGGRKNSSFGPREQGELAREFFTIVKTAYTKG